MNTEKERLDELRELGVDPNILELMNQENTEISPVPKSYSKPNSTEITATATSPPKSGVRNYEADGYKILEMYGPGYFHQIKYNDKNMVITRHSKIVYDGSMSSEARKILDSDPDFYRNFWADTSFDLNKVFEELDKPYTTNGKSSSMGCFGCLFWSIVLFVVTCLVLYGMGVLGGNIIEWFKSLF